MQHPDTFILDLPYTKRKASKKPKKVKDDILDSTSPWLNHKKTKPKTEPLKPGKAPQPWKSVSCKEIGKVPEAWKSVYIIETPLKHGKVSQLWRSFWSMEKLIKHGVV